MFKVNRKLKEIRTYTKQKSGKAQNKELKEVEREENRKKESIVTFNLLFLNLDRYTFSQQIVILY